MLHPLAHPTSPPDVSPAVVLSKQHSQAMHDIKLCFDNVFVSDLVQWSAMVPTLTDEVILAPFLLAMRTRHPSVPVFSAVDVIDESTAQSYKAQSATRGYGQAAALGRTAPDMDLNSSVWTPLESKPRPRTAGATARSEMSPLRPLAGPVPHDYPRAAWISNHCRFHSEAREFLTQVRQFDVNSLTEPAIRRMASVVLGQSLPQEIHSALETNPYTRDHAVTHKFTAAVMSWVRAVTVYGSLKYGTLNTAVSVLLPMAQRNDTMLRSSRPESAMALNPISNSQSQWQSQTTFDPPSPGSRSPFCSFLASTRRPPRIHSASPTGASPRKTVQGMVGVGRTPPITDPSLFTSEDQLKRVWASFEQDSNGLISKAAFRNFYSTFDDYGLAQPPQAIDGLLRQFNAYGDDVLCYDEFALILLRLARR
eukprot:NODE_1520_length_1386_cov_8.419596_g1264_i0.p1 GENE.NODE_1520_length_1386_cov_8.419596_g1264_i0~~NODE_1520_length_1386_cov_8.419596_g1264_i0.p1  ORF type:complete len:438 (+),score=49.34 NODE_1520_length_1386_cov_8.419596_g1264_i0:48-1316(+)